MAVTFSDSGCQCYGVAEKNLSKEFHGIFQPESLEIFFSVKCNSEAFEDQRGKIFNLLYQTFRNFETLYFRKKEEKNSGVSFRPKINA